jgi:hypothetical protein
MKFHVDKTETAPRHALRVRDLRHILARVPSNWIAELNEVHLSNSLEFYAPQAVFSRYLGRLTVCSRRGTTEQAITAVVTELAGCALGINRRSRRRLSKADARRLQPLTQPLVHELMVAIAPPTRAKDHHSWTGFRPLLLVKESTEPEE